MYEFAFDNSVCMLRKSVHYPTNFQIFPSFNVSCLRLYEQNQSYITNAIELVDTILSKICDFSVNLIVIVKYKETFQGLIYCAENFVLDICQLGLSMIYDYKITPISFTPPFVACITLENIYAFILLIMFIILIVFFFIFE